MAWSLVRVAVLNLCFIRSSSSLIYVTPICKKESVIYEFSKTPLNVGLRYLCTSVNPPRLSWEGSSRDILFQKLDTCLKNHEINEAWDAYTDFKKLYGLPDGRLLSRFIVELSYSHEPKWLQRACDMILFLSKEKSNFLRVDLLHNLSLCLARAQMLIPASMIIRIMIEKENIPPANLLRPLVLHMVKKEIGTYLASNILIQICEHIHHSGSNKFIELDTKVFNLVLDACSSHNLSLKAQRIIELMSQIGVIGDAHTIVAIARIHAINGQRDELKKLKNCVDQAAVHLGHHYFQFYDSLLSLHFKYNDIDSASQLVFDMFNLAERKRPNKPYLIPLGSQNLKIGLKLQVLPHFLDENSLMKQERNEGLVMHKNGKFLLSNKAVAKLVVRYKREDRISDLSKLLYRIQTEQGSVEIENLSSDVIDACIYVGWLEVAHDILDDIEQEGNLLTTDSYASLLRAYYDHKKHREAEALLKQIREMGIIISNNPPVSEGSDLIKCLVHEMRNGEIDSSIYEFNSSIYFFMKAKMMDDALKTYRSMQVKKVFPSVATYVYMVTAYSSLEMYREITFLWGDIKRSRDDGNVSISRDLYEVLIINFLKGGYFERVMEVIVCMKKHGMYPDKWLYRSEFLKLHKDLYRKLKSSNARTEAQCKRVEHVKAFRKWAGID